MTENAASLFSLLAQHLYLLSFLLPNVGGFVYEWDICVLTEGFEFRSGLR